MTFPTSFPFSFPGGSFTPLPGYESIAGTSLAWIPDHGALGVDLLLWQFREKPRLEALLRALLAGVQDLEDGVWQMLTERWLDTAIGAQLDGLGQIVDLPRAGWSDGTYRALLRAQVRVLRSGASWPDLLGILDVLGIAVTLATTAEPGMAELRIALGAPIVEEFTALDVFGLLVRAKAAGVRMTFEFPTTAVADSFTWADGDVEQADAARGWGNDAATTGGLWADVYATGETV